MDTLTHGIVGACVATAAAQYYLPEAVAIAAATGFIAGLLPDLDYLFVFSKKPLLAWKYHRVALHNIFILPILAVVASIMACLGLPLLGLAPTGSSLEIIGKNSEFFTLFSIASLALASHLLCDYITSFGSSFFYPLTRRRFSLGTHFLTDPIIFILASTGMLFDHSLPSVIALVIYILFSVFLKQYSRLYALKVLRSQTIDCQPPSLFPRPGAPWRWLVVADQSTHYIFFTITPINHSPLKWVDKGLGSNARVLYRKDPLLQHFVKLSVCPRFEDTLRNGQPAIVVEDIQWWWALPTRPMAFSAIVTEGEIIQVRETSKFDKGPAGEPALPPLLNRPLTNNRDNS